MQKKHKIVYKQKTTKKKKISKQLAKTLLPLLPVAVFPSDKKNNIHSVT